MAALLLITVVALVDIIDAHPAYMTALPNGKAVPNPCKPGEKWAAFGHSTVGGHGDKIIKFGTDFAAAGRKWTVAFCQIDSDGDGKTNGQELGDPDCKWNGTGPAPVTSGLSHPGICEPVTSDNCKSKNTFLDKSNCQALASAASHFEIQLISWLLLAFLVLQLR